MIDVKTRVNTEKLIKKLIKEDELAEQEAKCKSFWKLGVGTGRGPEVITPGMSDEEYLRMYPF